jgi:Xaa-Pro aminopeptidase
MKKILLICIALAGMLKIHAQDAVPKPVNIIRHSDYDNDLLPASFHKQRREELRKLLPANTVALIFAAPVRNRSNDVDYEYHQSPDFYYLTGLLETDAVVVIYKEPQKFGDKVVNELLFVQERNPDQEIWTGKILGTDRAKNELLFEYVLPNKQFADFVFDFYKFDKIFIQPRHNDIRDDKHNRGDLFSMMKHFDLMTDTISKKVNKFKLNDFMARLRQIKTEEEIVLLKKAIEITCRSLLELARSLRPGMTEYQAEAIVQYVFHHHGAEHEGYPSILGGGENSCVLHYSTNRKKLYSKDLLVADVGAEYHGYTADVTRTLPTDGKFSAEEAAIYRIVYNAQEAAFTRCKPGNKFYAPHDTAYKVITDGLLKLGIIKKPEDVRKYFMHGTSHYLGLDVHDPGTYGPLSPGNVITVEPGIYIPEGSDCDPKWWNIGIRIEDDILITPTGYVNLSACVPRTIEEIEKLMSEQGFFENYDKK